MSTGHAHRLDVLVSNAGIAPAKLTGRPGGRAPADTSCASP
jgi:NAD(P)-dependent dehydrogenase (short-subunit alcohol dehydrogenase family)